MGGRGYGGRGCGGGLGGLWGGLTWVVEQHEQIKGRVAVLGSQVDVGAAAQQELDNVFITGDRKQRDKELETLTLSASAPPPPGLRSASVLPVIGGLHERRPTVDAVSFVHVCVLVHHQLDHLQLSADRRHHQRGRPLLIGRVHLGGILLQDLSDQLQVS